MSRSRVLTKQRRPWSSIFWCTSVTYGRHAMWMRDMRGPGPVIPTRTIYSVPAKTTIGPQWRNAKAGVLVLLTPSRGPAVGLRLLCSRRLFGPHWRHALGSAPQPRTASCHCVGSLMHGAACTASVLRVSVLDAICHVPALYSYRFRGTSRDGTRHSPVSATP